jgi:hypothetical protein
MAMRPDLPAPSEPHARVGWTRHPRLQNIIGGALIVVIGLVALQQGMSSDFGTMAQIGPGFMPAVLGVLLTILGILIMMSAPGGGEETSTVLPGPRTQWRAWICVIAGPALFIVIGQYAGFIPASLACVFVASMGDRSATLLSSALLAIGVTAVGGFVFIYLLNVPFPLLQWGAL